MAQRAESMGGGTGQEASSLRNSSFTEAEFLDTIKEFLEDGAGGEYAGLNVRIETYSEAGVLTSDEGLVVRFGGQIFHLTAQEVSR